MLAVWPIQAYSRPDNGLAPIAAEMTADISVYRLP